MCVLETFITLVTIWSSNYVGVVKGYKGVKSCLKLHSHFHVSEFLNDHSFHIMIAHMNQLMKTKVHKNKKAPSKMSSPNCVWVGSILDQGLTIKLRSVFLLRKGTSSSGHSGLIKHMHIISDHPNGFPFFKAK